MAARQIAIRLAVEGAERARAQLEALRADAQRAGQEGAPTATQLRQWETLNRTVDATYRATDRYAQVVERVQRAEQAGLGTAEQRNRLLEQAALAHQRATGAMEVHAGGTRGFGMAMGQAGFQVQDFATQVAMGQNALLAFGVQFAQFAGVFGTAGAIAGAAVTIGVLAAQFVGLGNAATAFETVLDEIEASYRRVNDAAEARVRGATEEAEAIARLTAAYGSLSIAGRTAEGLALARQQQALDEQAQALRRSATGGLRGRTDPTPVDLSGMGGALSFLGGEARPAPDPAMAAATAAIRAYDAAARLTVETQRELAAALDAAARLGGPSARAILDQRNAVLDALPQLHALEEAQRRLVTQTIAVMQAQGASRAEIEHYASRFGALGAEILRTATALQALRRIATDQPLAELEQDAAQIEAQLRALRSGGLAALEAMRAGQEDNARAVEASNRVYAEQLRLLREQGLAQEAAEEQAGLAARAALDLMTRRNAAARQLAAEQRAAEDAARDAERAARDAAQASARTSEMVRRAAEQERRELEQARALLARDEQQALERQQRAHERVTDSIVQYSADAFADLFAETSKGWQGMLERFEQLARQTFARIAAEAIIRPIVTPMVAALGLGAAEGGSGIMAALGLGGVGASLSSALSTPLWGSAAAGAGMFAEAAPAAMGMSHSAALGAAGMGPSLGATLGVAGLGALGGGVLANMTGGNSTGGAVGGALGATAGFLLGGPAGALVGGAAGGAIGGLIGPGKGSSFYNVSVGADAEGRLAILDSGGKRADQQLAALTQQTEQQLKALNAQLAALGLTVAGQANLGANVAGANQIASLDELTTQITLQAADPRLQAAITRAGGGDFARSLAAAQQAQALIEQLDGFARAAADAADPLGAVRRQFDTLRETAQRLGFGLEEVNAAQDRALQQARERLQQPIATTIGGLADYALRLRTANDNAGAPLARLGAADQQFSSSLAAALGGDLRALGRLQGSAETLRQLAREVYGTGQGFAEVEARIVAALDQIGRLDDDTLTASALAAETRGQTETLVAALSRLQDEVKALRREVQQQGSNPLLGRAA